MTEARKKANEKYLEKLEEIKVRVPKGKKQMYKEKAWDKGMSLNQYIIWLIENDSVNAAIPDLNQK